MSDTTTNVKVETSGAPPVVLMPMPLKTRLSSRKLWSMILVVGISWLCLERGVDHLYSLGAQQAYVYGGMFAAVLTLIGCVVCKYLDIPTAFTGAGGFTGSLSAAGQGIAQTLSERREERIVSEHTETQIIDDMAARYRDDPSYRPIAPDTTEAFR